MLKFNKVIKMYYSHKKTASTYELLRAAEDTNLRQFDKDMLKNSIQVGAIDNFDDLNREIERYKFENGTRF